MSIACWLHNTKHIYNIKYRLRRGKKCIRIPNTIFHFSTFTWPHSYNSFLCSVYVFMVNNAIDIYVSSSEHQFYTNFYNKYLKALQYIKENIIIDQWRWWWFFVCCWILQRIDSFESRYDSTECLLKYSMRSQLSCSGNVRPTKSLYQVNVSLP